MRISKFALSLFFSLLLISYAQVLLAKTLSNLTLFPTLSAAQSHCPNDEVVWLNTSTSIWHTQGGRWFGNTKHGAYVCKQEAAEAGNRASLNG